MPNCSGVHNYCGGRRVPAAAETDLNFFGACGALKFLRSRKCVEFFRRLRRAIIVAFQNRSAGRLWTGGGLGAFVLCFWEKVASLGGWIGARDCCDLVGKRVPHGATDL